MSKPLPTVRLEAVAEQAWRAYRTTRLGGVSRTYDRPWTETTESERAAWMAAVAVVGDAMRSELNETLYFAHAAIAEAIGRAEVPKEPEMGPRGELTPYDRLTAVRSLLATARCKLHVLSDQLNKHGALRTALLRAGVPVEDVQ